MVPFNDENKLQVGEKNNENWKTENSFQILKMQNIINFITIPYKLTALGKIIHSIPNYRLMKPASILLLPKE